MVVFARGGGRPPQEPPKFFAPQIFFFAQGGPTNPPPPPLPAHFLRGERVQNPDSRNGRLRGNVCPPPLRSSSAERLGASSAERLGALPADRLGSSLGVPSPLSPGDGRGPGVFCGRAGRGTLGIIGWEWVAAERGSRWWRTLVETVGGEVSISNPSTAFSVSGFVSLVFAISGFFEGNSPRLHVSLNSRFPETPNA